MSKTTTEPTSELDTGAIQQTTASSPRRAGDAPRLSLVRDRARLPEVRLNTLSNLMTLVATVELLTVLGMGLDRWSHSYQFQRSFGVLSHRQR